MFLSLTGILIMALLGTLLETARYTVCANHAARTTRVATEALFTEYSRPLYDHYGLFFLEDTGVPLEQVIARYASCTMEGAGKGTMDFLSGEIRRIEVEQKTYAGDDGAKPLQQEIRQYMLRYLTEKQLNKFRKNTDKLSNVEEKAGEIEKKVEEEKKESRLDSGILRLMQLIDGITVRGGKISCSDTFVKMFVTGEKKAQNFGITQGVVWNKMKGRLDETPVNWESINPGKFKKKVDKVLALTKEAMQEAENLQKIYRESQGAATEFSEHREKIRDLLDSMKTLRVNEKILQTTSDILRTDISDDTREKLRVLWKDYDTKSIVFDYTGAGEKGGAKNPLSSLGAGWKNGILNLVCENVKDISNAQVENPDNHAQLYQETKGEETDCGGRVESFAKDQTVALSGVLGDAGNYGMDEFCLDSYISEMMSGYVGSTKKENTDWEPVLKYQWEYVVAGRSSDRENLKAVLERILMIRTVINFTAIYKDAGKKAQAYEMALAIVGFSGMEPLVRLTQTLLLLLCALIEGMVDIAGLLQERDVPLMKSPSQVLTGMGELFAITNQAIVQRAKKWGKAGKKSFGYTDYILLFMACMKQSIRRYRIMDVIQMDMVKNGYSRFSFSTCVYSVEVSGGYSFPTRFFRMAAIEKMLGRNVREISYTCSISHSYL